MREEILEPVFRALRIKIVNKHLNKEHTYCDVGCGSGMFLRSISPYISRGYGFDKKIREETAGNLTFRNAHIDENIPLESDSVDCVTMMAVLEHLEKPEPVLAECLRILKNGGKIILTTPSPVSQPILEFLSYRLNVVSQAEIRDHKHYYSKEEIGSLLGRTGFKQVKVRSFEFGLNNFAIGRKP